MARKQRTIAGFDQVATTPANEPQPESSLEGLFREKKAQTQMGFYIDQELADVLKGLHREHGRGTNSKVVNQALREFFERQNLLG